jgi:hypothetical protein
LLKVSFSYKAWLPTAASLPPGGPLSAFLIEEDAAEPEFLDLTG